MNSTHRPDRPSRSWRVRTAVAATGALMAAGAAAAVAVGHQSTPLSARSVAATLASWQDTPGTADQVALAYADAHYPGTTTARALETEADIERGMPVYDVRVLAPNGTAYVLHIARSNGAVLRVDLAEQQPTTSPAVPPETSVGTTPAEPSTSTNLRETPEPREGATIAPVQGVSPEPSETPEPADD